MLFGGRHCEQQAAWLAAARACWPRSDQVCCCRGLVGRHRAHATRPPPCGLLDRLRNAGKVLAVCSSAGISRSGALCGASAGTVGARHRARVASPLNGTGRRTIPAEPLQEVLRVPCLDLPTTCRTSWWAGGCAQQIPRGGFKVQDRQRRAPAGPGVVAAAQQPPTPFSVATALLIDEEGTKGARGKHLGQVSRPGGGWLSHKSCRAGRPAAFPRVFQGLPTTPRCAIRASAARSCRGAARAARAREGFGGPGGPPLDFRPRGDLLGGQKTRRRGRSGGSGSS